MIVFDNVTLTINGKTVIRDFSLDVRAGEKVVIRGRSGIGKSTIFRLILGFLSPEDGRLLLHGKPLDKDNVWSMRKKVAYVSQDLDIGEGTVRQIIDRAFCFKVNNRLKPSHNDVDSLLDFFELKKDILTEDFAGLSGGEKQRISIILAVLMKRDIFLLDEATSALDGDLKGKVIGYFLNTQDWTVISISHDDAWLADGVKVVSLGAL
ncbi:ATP-binding cassette domain-containing protein [candidate division KSB1 bacterium]